MHTRAVILAGGEGTRLGVLTAKRTKPAVPFAGKYRIIDFPLSNCVNSNIFDVMLITQYRPQSLIHHIGSGGPWDLNREFTGGIKIFTPYKTQGINWFSGTADAVMQNLSYILSSHPDYVLILSGDHVYSMDYAELIRYHESKKAEITICVHSVPKSQASRFGVVEMDRKMRVTNFVEKPENPTSSMVNMGTYLFNAETLEQLLIKDAREITSQHDFGKNIIPAVVKSNVPMVAYPFQDYWVDVGTVQSYWNAHMDLLTDPPKYDIRDRHWVIHTRSEERAPAYIHPNTRLYNSLICDGCIIEPNVLIKNSVLSPGVIIHAGTQIIDSIILTDSIIGEQGVVLRSVIDKHTNIGARSQIGYSDGKRTRISMIGKNAILPDETMLENGGMVGCDVKPADLPEKRIHFGELVLPKERDYDL